ncbi:hypothetical protein ACFLQ0_01065 [Nitrospinota bacterium]
MNPAGSLKIRSGPLRTLQRWDWHRSGGEVDLTGLIVFLGNVPSEELWVAVELFDQQRSPLAAAAVQLNSHDLQGWGVASIQAVMETEVTPPYRLRVRYLEKNLPALTDRTLDPETPEIRPWNQRELRSSS